MTDEIYRTKIKHSDFIPLTSAQQAALQNNTNMHMQVYTEK